MYCQGVKTPKKTLLSKQKHFSLKKYLGLSVKVQGGTFPKLSSGYASFLLAANYSGYTSF